MKCVRQGMFETNSSSSHSMVIVCGEYPLGRLPETPEGTIELFGGEFGWEVEIYSDAFTKASYCLTYAKTGGGEQCEEMLRTVLESTTGLPVVFRERDDEYYPWGYIDHQSHVGEGNICAVAFQSQQALRDFIFNEQSTLLTDNDNHE